MSDFSEPLALERLTPLASKALDAARAAGADAADASAVASLARGVTVRNRQIEDVENAEDVTVALRAFVGQRSALVRFGAASDMAAAAERAVAMARAAPADPTVRLARPDEYAQRPDASALDINDDAMPSAEDLEVRARKLEEAMYSIAGIANSGGASASVSAASRVLATSEGFLAGYRQTRHSHSGTAIAGEGTRMERDSWFSVRRHLADLEDVATVGKTAGHRTVRRMGAEPLTTRKATVVFEPRAAAGFVGHLLSAINGQSVARGASIMAGRLGDKVYPDGITVRDDPLTPRGIASRPFDGEGLPSAALDLVADGVLSHYLLDLATAARLSMEGNARASRGTGSPAPSSTNVSIRGGAGTMADLMREADRGLLITDLIGVGANIVSGNYSRGAAGFWFEHGDIVRPVSEITVAGDLADMFRRARFADDAPGLFATDAPSLAIDGMTIGGR